MKKEILRMQDVCVGNYKSYGLDHFRLHVCEGEMVDVIGLSGSGKTMIYEYFLGHLPLQEGKVIYNGKTCKVGENFQDITQVICIGQDSTLIPSLSVAENIFLITGKRKIKGFVWMPHVYYRAKMLLGQYAPELSPNTLVQDLPEAEKRVVELLRAIENEVQLVVIDDVFQGYGQNDILRIKKLMQTIKEKKIAILYATHEMDFSRTLADKAVVLRRGKTVRTFYKTDYDEQLCRKLLIGNDELPGFERTTVKGEEVVFQARGLQGESATESLNLEIHAGEIVGLYDLNNQKNMEVLEMIMGKQPIKEGTMYLKERRYVPKNLDYAIGCNIGFMSQNGSEEGLVESMSLTDNLCMPVLKKTSHLKLFPNRKISEYLSREYMDGMGIPYEEGNKKIKNFDAYIQNSIMLTRWVLFRPTLMVCMEPWGNADIIMREITFRALGDMAKNKTAVLIASQNINELKTICDTVYVLNSAPDERVVRYDMQR